jgi:hypothetical protein
MLVVDLQVDDLNVDDLHVDDLQVKRLNGLIGKYVYRQVE